MSTWKLDPWYTESERFYTTAFKGGMCQYCGRSIDGDNPLAVCDCRGLAKARAMFKARLYDNPMAAVPGRQEVMPQYNPDRFHEQEAKDGPIF